MALKTTSPISTLPATTAPDNRRTWLLTVTSFAFIVLQSACTAVIALSGVRVAIGLSALAVATIGATLGSLINLYVIWRIRSLRARPSSQWRTQPATPTQRRSEFLQISLAILTLILVAAEWVAHSMVHRVP
jgi:hypothetical protein